MSDMELVRRQIDIALELIEKGTQEDLVNAQEHLYYAKIASYRNRRPRKPNLGIAKLTEEQKGDIRKAYFQGGIPMQLLAQRLGVNIGRIHEAIHADP